MSITRRHNNIRETIDLVAQNGDRWLAPNCTGGYWYVLPWDSVRTPWLTMRSSWKVDADRNLFAKALSTIVNRELHFDGIWVIGWTDYDLLQAIPTRLFMALFDKDGDMPLFIDSEDPWVTMAGEMMHYVESCERAFRRFQEHEKDLEIRPSDKILTTRGQKSADPTVFPAHMPQMFD